jgi:hypothetical protein
MLPNRRHALVEQGGGDPLVPATAFIGQVFIPPDDSPHFQHVLRRDPAFGQVPGQQVDPQVPGIGLVRMQMGGAISYPRSRKLGLE